MSYATTLCVVFMYINLPFHPRNPETAELLVELITGRHLADFPAELRERVLNRCVDICNNYLREYLRIHYGPEVVGFYERDRKSTRLNSSH